MKKVAYFKFSITIHENHYKAATLVMGQMLMKREREAI
jgi:hypothetical protein